MTRPMATTNGVLKEFTATDLADTARVYLDRLQARDAADEALSYAQQALDHADEAPGVAESALIEAMRGHFWTDDGPQYQPALVAGDFALCLHPAKGPNDAPRIEAMSATAIG